MNGKFKIAPFAWMDSNEKKTAGYEAEKKIEKLTRMGYLGKHKRTQVDEENGLIDQSSDSIYCLFYFI
jgi:hypothetical protein